MYGIYLYNIALTILTNQIFGLIGAETKIRLVLADTVGAGICQDMRLFTVAKFSMNFLMTRKGQAGYRIRTYIDGNDV